MRKLALLSLALLLLFACSRNNPELQPTPHDLVFDDLATTWDEGIPLGNGMLGALIWQNGKNLRISLDRADLWDLRPMVNMFKEEFNYQWVYDKWAMNAYDTVQKIFDRPYNQNAGPSKIPAGAIEVPMAGLGKVRSVRLYTHQGICEVIWENGTKLNLFVNAEENVGWFNFENLPDPIDIKLIPPVYSSEDEGEVVDGLTGQELTRLGYPKGNLKKDLNSWTYAQEGWNGFNYEIDVSWEKSQSGITGCWSISSHYPDQEKGPDAPDIVEEAWEEGYMQSLKDHLHWWKVYWNRATSAIPDTILEKQWYLEMYKFGCIARQESPPISLQAVWTADNGRLPPWKGDFHHDLNTQLSYWPAYSGNHLDLENGFIDWLWNIRETGKKYTKWYYEVDGLNIPGVTTLRGEPMGGWIQYSLGPTVSAWLGHHFYLHWRYSMDQDFLTDRAYPWIKDVAIFLDQISIRDSSGIRKLPISSSPEIYNNSREAWFGQTTNFDLGLIRFTYEKAIEMAEVLGLQDDAGTWKSILDEWPSYAVDGESGLMFAPGYPYDESHRHFSHLMAFHPLGLVDMSKGEQNQIVIRNTLRNLEQHGTDWWVGYSFSWLGNLYARSFEGDNAAEILRTFATCFTLPNSFHVNGDQSGTGKSRFTYRPFTLEGNFAFASGIQEMLIQSHTNIIRIFPAIPNDWQDLSFNNLRTEGAFLVSAQMEQGITTDVRIVSEKGETLKLANPFVNGSFLVNGKPPDPGILVGEVINLPTNPGEVIVFTLR